MPANRLREIHKLVGESTSLWNQVEELWYLIFTVMMAETERAKIDAIYGLFHAGALQRQLITVVAPIAFHFEVAALKKRDRDAYLRRDFLKRVGKLNARTNDLSGRRNAVVHTGFEIAEWILPPRIVAISPHKRSKLADEDHISYLAILIEDVTLLGYDLADLRDDLISWIEGLDKNARAARNELWRQRGLRIPEDERKAAREALLQVVAARKPRPPQS